MLAAGGDGFLSLELLPVGGRDPRDGRAPGAPLARARERARLVGRGLPPQPRLEYLQVKTLGPSRPDPGYEATRRFYEASGFRPLEELHGLWPGNPCLLLVKRL
jgi:hypothetical protein